MQKIMVPVDASPNSLYAVRHIIDEYMKHSTLEIHLINVQPPFSRYVARFVSKKNRNAWHREQAEKVLRPCRDLLEKQGIPYSSHIEKGAKAEAIVAAAKRLHCDLIVMSTARKNSLTRMLEASVTNQVLELTSVPVEVIAGGSVPWLERVGLPIGIGSVIAILLVLALN